MQGIRGSYDALGSVAAHCSSDLLGDRKSQTVYNKLLRVLPFQLIGVQILEDIHADVSAEEVLARAIRFIIKMMLFNVFSLSKCSQIA